MKRYNKLVKLTPKPLILKDARDYLAYRLDTGLGRSAWFEPIGMTSNVSWFTNFNEGVILLK